MRYALLLFCAGITGAAFFSDVPAALQPAQIGFSLLLLISFVVVRLYPHSLLTKAICSLCCVLLGLLWHLLWADRLLQQRLPERLEGMTMLVEGVVLGLPQRSAIAQQFEFNITDSESGFVQRKVLLNYYGSETIVPGQFWRFAVRLNRPHGFSNPGGFDYEGWLFQRRISAKGYVRNRDDNQLLAEFAPFPVTGPSALMNYWRYGLKSRIEKVLAGSPAVGLILALTLGDKSAISQSEWQLFSATGSNHLFVISGLHIGMVAGFFYYLLMLLLRLLQPSSFAYPAQKTAAFVALLAAFVYALLAGFTLPTQRALIMIAVFMLGSLSSRQYLVSFRYLLALAVVLALNPLAMTTSGFWLSFSAVAALLLAVNVKRTSLIAGQLRNSFREKLANTIYYLVKPQFVVFVALSLPLVFWNQPLSLLSPLVNIIAIPIVGFLVLPLCFLALVVSVINEPLSGLLFVLVDNILTKLLGFMGYFLESGGEIFVFGFSGLSPWHVLPLFFAVLLLLLPKAVVGRALVVPLCMPVLLPIVSVAFPLAENTAKTELLRFHIVDVGQGLAAILETAQHVLVYDTGANLSPDFNIGSAVLVPVLHSLGISAIDKVVISHGDNDHAGGLSGLESSMTIKHLISNDADMNSNLKVSLCTESDSWEWDGVEFRFLQTRLDYASENNNSCVLQIIFAETRILLPGDIEREAEIDLVLRYGRQLDSTVLIAPHHGSASSSSYGLLKHARPTYVVFSAGYRNSFNHPNEEVVARYLDFGSVVLFTADTGMISFDFDSQADPARQSSMAKLYREENSRYWH